MAYLFFADSLYNLEGNFSHYSRSPLTASPPPPTQDHLCKVDKTIFSLNLELSDKSIYENALRLVQYYKVESIAGRLELSQSPKKEDKTRRDNKFIEANFALECDVRHGIAGLLEGVFSSAQQQAQLMEQHQHPEQQQPHTPPSPPTPLMPSRLFGFSNFLKRFSLNLAFDSFQELVETSFGAALPEQYRIFNWDAISAYVFNPILNLICSKDEKYANPPSLAHSPRTH